MRSASIKLKRHKGHESGSLAVQLVGKGHWLLSFPRPFVICALPMNAASVAEPAHRWICICMRGLVVAADGPHCHLLERFRAPPVARAPIGTIWAPREAPPIQVAYCRPSPRPARHCAEFMAVKCRRKQWRQQQHRLACAPGAHGTRIPQRALPRRLQCGSALGDGEIWGAGAARQLESVSRLTCRPCSRASTRTAVCRVRRPVPAATRGRRDSLKCSRRRRPARWFPSHSLQLVTQFPRTRLQASRGRERRQCSLSYRI